MGIQQVRFKPAYNPYTEVRQSFFPHLLRVLISY
jgi:phenylalanyl-tRNA synthetase alpha subunit